MNKPPEIVRAPWTQWQIESLAAYQTSGVMHPYTCGGGRGHDPERAHPPHTSLVPTRDGWTCPHCDYTQDWAHGFSVDWRWIMCHAGPDDRLPYRALAKELRQKLAATNETGVTEVDRLRGAIKDVLETLKEGKQRRLLNGRAQRELDWLWEMCNRFPWDELNAEVRSAS